nr:d4.3 [Tranosema rostrale ichnovirus]
MDGFPCSKCTNYVTSFNDKVRLIEASPRMLCNPISSSLTLLCCSHISTFHRLAQVHTEWKWGFVSFGQMWSCNELQSVPSVAYTAEYLGPVKAATVKKFKR